MTVHAAGPPLQPWYSVQTNTLATIFAAITLGETIPITACAIPVLNPLVLELRLRVDREAQASPWGCSFPVPRFVLPIIWRLKRRQPRCISCCCCARGGCRPSVGF